MIILRYLLGDKFMDREVFYECLRAGWFCFDESEV